MSKIVVDTSEAFRDLLFEGSFESSDKGLLSFLDGLGLEVGVTGASTAPITGDHIIRLGIVFVGKPELVATA